MKIVPDELVIELSKTLTLGSGDEAVEYSSLRLQEPTVEQLSQFVRKSKSENNFDAMKFLISIVSGVPLPVLSKVGIRDFYKAMEYMTSFISPPAEDDPEGNGEGSQ